MYEKIMTAELKFPRHFLPETRSLLSGMLTRRVEDRLGYGGVEEVRRRDTELIARALVAHTAALSDMSVPVRRVALCVPCRIPRIPRLRS